MQRERDRQWWAAVVVSLAIAVLLAHGLALQAPFQFDDIHLVEQNPVYRDPSGLGRLLTDPWAASSTGYVRLYRPLYLVSLWVDGQIGDGAPMPYRTTSLLLLLGLAGAVVWWARELLPHLAPDASVERVRLAAWLAGLLVAVHPLLDGAVVMATGRSSLLVAVLGLPALTLLARPLHFGRAAAVALLCTGALLAKEEAVALAGPALGVVWLTRADQPGPVRLLQAWPVVVPVALFLAFYFLVLPEWAASTATAVIENPGGPRPWSVRIPVGGVALLGLARLALVPNGLSLVHELDDLSTVQRSVGISAWALFVVAVGWAWRAGGAWRVVGFGLAWFCVSLAPVVVAGLNTPMGEYRTALGLGGLALAAAWLLAGIPGRNVRGALIAGVLAVLAFTAMRHTAVFHTTTGLWTWETERHPTSGRAWSFLAEALHDELELPGATAAIERAISLSPTHPMYRSQAATIALERGDYASAERHLQVGLAAEPDLWSLQLLEAYRLVAVGRYAEAEAPARRATQLAPGNPNAWLQLGVVLQALERPEARTAFERALSVDPFNRSARQQLRRIDGAR